MPTGYTYPVVEGVVTEFPDFALSCARAFGALISMREEPIDAPIPNEFYPSTYNETRLAECQARLADLNAMTEADVQSKCDAAYAEAVAAHDKYEANCVEQDRRLDAMLAKVTAWTPPTADHIELKEFMINQLAISKSGTYRPAPPTKHTPAEWHSIQIAQTLKEIEYNAGEYAKEIKRVADRTEWVKALRRSLDAAREKDKANVG